MAQFQSVFRGPLLIPQRDGGAKFFADGVLAGDELGKVAFAGDWAAIASLLGSATVHRSRGVMMPPFIDIHTHVPQHPIRGRFVEGVPDDAPGGKLLAGLQKNVFPNEAKCDARNYAEAVVREFLRDTLSHGVVGGAVYVTPSPVATEAALSILPDSWSVGFVLMNQNCPEYLRTREATLEADFDRLAEKYGKRLIMTDRFAVAVDSPLRKRGVAIAAKHGLRTQTHLNEQVLEKMYIERSLYPGQTYTDVYLKDGLLNHNCIVAHCIQMTDPEWAILRDTGSVVAHCPTSNLLLGSGVMPLDQVKSRNLPYAIATDVGASPTVSMLAEMGRFIAVHRGTSTHATPLEALYRATLAPAEILGIDSRFGLLEPGHELSFIDVTCPALPIGVSAEPAVRALIPANLDNPAHTVQRVTIAGKNVYERGIR